MAKKCCKRQGRVNKMVSHEPMSSELWSYELWCLYNWRY